MILSATSGIRYIEHENQNSYRNYPFSETADMADSDGNTLPADVFVDASLYPVVDVARALALSTLDFAGKTVVVSDGYGVELSGWESNGVVELYDSLGRHSGSIVCGPGWDREAPAMTRRTFSGAEFSPAVQNHVVHRGVISMSDEDRTWRTTRRDIVFRGDGMITPVMSFTRLGPELRFDAQYTPPPSGRRLVNQLVFVVTGDTLFDIAMVDDGAVEVAMPPMDREDVCWQAHREDAVAVVADACSEEQDSCDVPTITARNDYVEVCPNDIGNISLFADDMTNYKNPVKVSTIHGSVTQPRSVFSKDMSFDKVVQEGAKSLGRLVVHGNGIKISIPGVTNGQ